jgi:hypothetical protein
MLLRCNHHRIQAVGSDGGQASSRWRLLQLNSWFALEAARDVVD